MASPCQPPLRTRTDTRTTKVEDMWRSWVAGLMAGSAAMTGVPGAAGAGDPYFPLDGNGGYDVAHYRIDDRYRPGPDRLRGTTTISATATAELSAFHLDLALRPDAVRVNGQQADFGKPNPHELRIEPKQPIASGATFTVQVHYSGHPWSAKAVGQSPVFSGHGETMAIGEPQIGPWWFAANETPADKATYDVTLRVPHGRQAVSNGELVGKKRHGKLTSWHWRMTDPMTTYLAFFAVGRFQLDKAKVAGRTYRYAVSELLGPKARKASMRLLHRTPGVVSWLEEQLGPYPFTSSGGVVTGLFVSFALENQGRPVYPYLGGPSRGNIRLLVHENAHQWFGDDVSVERWRDVWLNEGLATYAEWLYAAAHGGRPLAQHLQDAYDEHPADAGFWELRVSDPGPERMFDQPVYERGAMMLAALGELAGADRVRALLRTWVDRHAGGSGTGEQFRALAEEVTGVDLDGFFTHWLDDRQRPDATSENGLA